MTKRPSTLSSSQLQESWGVYFIRLASSYRWSCITTKQITANLWPRERPTRSTFSSHSINSRRIGTKRLQPNFHIGRLVVQKSGKHIFLFRHIHQSASELLMKPSLNTCCS